MRVAPGAVSVNAGMRRAVILVEGDSDRGAVLALARRLGRDLAEEGTAVVAMGGATNIGRHLDLYGPTGLDLRLSGLCDQGEAPWFQAALSQRGLTANGELESAGFHICVVDLEDELIRALGPEAVLEVMTARGQLNAFRRFQRQPDHRHEDLTTQLWSWMSNWKVRYAPLLVDALDLDVVPSPLRAVLDGEG